MHKPFYASGFLYHSNSQQILLQQQKTGEINHLTFFSGSSHNGTSPQIVFQKCVEKALGVPIKTTSIHPVYDYIHDKLVEDFIFYVDVSDTVTKTYASKTKTGWIALSKIAKSSMSEQTRHDIVVGERVIRADITPQT